MKNLSIERFPKSANRSLRAWSAADEFLINYCSEHKLDDKSKVIYNDSFGYLTVNLSSSKLFTVVNQKSQERAILSNLDYNKIDFNNDNLVNPLSDLNDKVDVALIKVPKTLDLFELYLQHASNNLNEEGEVVCAFMTRHFSKGMLEIAETYFETVEQSKAVKKARLLILKNKKEVKNSILINTIKWNDADLQQYYGVFSANTTDYATQFLIENMVVPENVNKALDLASGNGVLALEVQKTAVEAEIHLLDDSFLAIESSKLNVKGDSVVFHYTNDLNKINNSQFDYVISNPPFHVEHEIDINLPIELFRQVHRCLSDSGSFQLVANNHLNYKTHLDKIFGKVEIIAQNDKFVVYSCSK